MVFDESSFDASNMPGTSCRRYRQHLRHSTAKPPFVVEGAGDQLVHRIHVLTGLSGAVYGRFATSSSASGRAVEAGCHGRCANAATNLQLLLYLGRVPDARSFQQTAGIEIFTTPGPGADGSNRRFFLMTAARVITETRTKTAVSVCLYHRDHPLDYQYGGLTPGLSALRHHPTWMNICAADPECARLQSSQSCQRLSDGVLPGGALRRSSAGARMPRMEPSS